MSGQRFIRHLILPLIAPATLVCLYFTPKPVARHDADSIITVGSSCRATRMTRKSSFRFIGKASGENNQCRKLFLAGLLITIFWMLPEIILAQENVDRNGFVLGGRAGYGQMNVNTDNISRSSYGTFALGFSGGYAITSKIVMGIEINGWTLKAFNTEDPSKGESVSNVSIFINYFPFVHLPLFIEGGGGQLSYTNNSPNVNGRDKGGSWFVGSGYEIPISNKLIFVPQIRYSQGNFTGGDFKVYELALGMHWYSGKHK